MPERMIRCDCGVIVRGSSDEELLKKADAHIRQDHPDLVGKIQLESLLAMAEEV